MRKLILINFLMVIALCVNAQIDITKYYLENYGFDDKFDYKSGQTKLFFPKFHAEERQKFFLFQDPCSC